MGVGGPDGLRDFWKASAEQDWVKKHPHVAQRDPDSLVPIWVHGDSAKVYKARLSDHKISASGP